jgi:hypothetical protein
MIDTYVDDKYVYNFEQLTGKKMRVHQFTIRDNFGL